MADDSGGPEGSPIDWLVKRIISRKPIEEKPKEPLFSSLEESVPLFFQAAMLDSLHDMWRLNSKRLIYRLGVIMGQKMLVELGEKLGFDQPETWDETVQQLEQVLKLFSSKVSVTKTTRIYARFEREGCPCRSMSFALDYCPMDLVIDGIMAGYALQALDDERIYCRHTSCGRKSEDGLCVHELRIKED